MYVQKQEDKRWVSSDYFCKAVNLANADKENFFQWLSLRSMAVLVAKYGGFVEPGARENEPRSRGKNKNRLSWFFSCSHPNLLAVFLPSPAFIT